MAAMLVQLGKKDEAEAALEEAVRLNPDYRPARENLQKIRAQRKTVDAAKAAAGKSATGEKKPAEKKPAAQEPAAQKPAAQKPAAQKPNATQADDAKPAKPEK